ncbi:uncharacterized protein TNCV_659621 [Trichonephila clavipes]|nr:uncharacterized protein TNCV_659621 [Trichonephila clavipes]
MKEKENALMNKNCLNGETVLEAKREEFVDDALTYYKTLCEEPEILFGPPRRISRKDIFGDGIKDVQLSYEKDLRRTKFSSIDGITAEIRERFQQLQNLAQKYSFFHRRVRRVFLSTDELNLDQASQDIKKKEFQLKRVCLQAFVASTDPSCKKELIMSGSLGLLKYIIESEDGLPNIVIMLRIFLTSVLPAEISEILCMSKTLPECAEGTSHPSRNLDLSWDLHFTSIVSVFLRIQIAHCKKDEVMDRNHLLGCSETPR